MSSSQMPFYTQAALLDRYVQNPEPGADPEVLQIILEILRARPDMQDYFFRSRPHPAWVPILWDQGYLTNPPAPTEPPERDYVMPRWLGQQYLISVAQYVSEYVVKHVQQIEGHRWYLSQAVRALCYIPPKAAEQAIPRLREWLSDPDIAPAVATQASDLLVNLAEADCSAAALSLFRALTAPIPSPEVKKTDGFTWGAEAISKFRNNWDQEQMLQSGLAALSPRHAEDLIAILEDDLCTAIDLEAAAQELPELVYASWWRTAIEDTGQDLHSQYKQVLLKALRDTLQEWAKQDPETARPLIRRYLAEKREILRRLGLHLLNRFPDTFETLVAQELGNRVNLDDTGVRHEFFVLLRQGYACLKAGQQKALLSAILDGPPPERKEMYAARAEDIPEVGADQLVPQLSDIWIRDRLWMLKEHLTGHPREALELLLDDYGQPEHPEFTRWSDGAFTVQDVSPFSEQQVSQMSPNDLVTLLEGWQPDPDREFGPERISYRGVGEVVARVIVNNPERYVDHIAAIALQRPEFAYALVDQFTSREKNDGAGLWQYSIDLCQRLMGEPTARTDSERGPDWPWISVRLAMVRLLRLGFKNQGSATAAQFLPAVRDLLLILIDDPDPDPASDQPPEGYLGHNDPATVAINHVRPLALIALMEYARFRANLDQETESPEASQPSHLEPSVREALTRKLDRKEDPSRAVHSVYGAYLYLLDQLDRNWLESHIDQIFPDDDDEEASWCFAAAWDSFVLTNEYWPKRLLLLRPKYRQSIHNLNRGFVTHPLGEPEIGLAGHLVWEYLLSDRDISLRGEAQPLLVLFFELAPPEARGHVPWALWRIGADDPTAFQNNWSRIRALWQWRAQEASAANHSADFNQEMQWFAYIPILAPANETINSLWPLLEAFLPFLGRSQLPDMIWDKLEEYLAREVKSDPRRSIQFYRLMHEHAKRPVLPYRQDEAREIIEIAATDRASREEALSLIDSLARRGDHQYGDIYDHYA